MIGARTGKVSFFDIQLRALPRSLIVRDSSPHPISGFRSREVCVGRHSILSSLGVSFISTRRPLPARASLRSALAISRLCLRLLWYHSSKPAGCALSNLGVTPTLNISPNSPVMAGGHRRRLTRYPLDSDNLRLWILCACLAASRKLPHTPY